MMFLEQGINPVLQVTAFNCTILPFYPLSWSCICSVASRPVSEICSPGSSLQAEHSRAQKYVWIQRGRLVGRSLSPEPGSSVSTDTLTSPWVIWTGLCFTYNPIRSRNTWTSKHQLGKGNVASHIAHDLSVFLKIRLTSETRHSSLRPHLWKYELREIKCTYVTQNETQRSASSTGLATPNHLDMCHFLKNILESRQTLAFLSR